MTTKKQNKGAAPKKAMRHIKTKHEAPGVVFLAWLTNELKSVKPGDTIYLSFDKLNASVFTPAKISESSAYLFINRLIQNRCVSVKKLGHIINTGGRGRGFTFIPHRRSAPVTAEVKPINGNPPPQPYHEWEGRLRSIEITNNLILTGLSALMKELGVSITPTK